MYSRNQYLKKVQEDYLKASKIGKSNLLNEVEKRTGLCRKHLIVKLSAKSSFRKKERKKRDKYYDSEFISALVRMWEIFDYPCGQRLKTSLEDETERLRSLGELICSDEVARKLEQVSSATIDRGLVNEKEYLLLRKKQKKKNPLLYQKIPVKLSDEQDRSITGNIQLDLVEHCGQSAAGEYAYTLSNTDISSGWWEGEAQLGKGQRRTEGGIKEARIRFPFPWKEIHSDNDTSFINWHLYHYTQKETLGFSRSRPNKKNDNCLVEQKNWTHVRKFVGYQRYDIQEEVDILNDLYRDELRFYKNFFQPVIKLISKERVGGKIKRKYDKAKTPYQRIMESREAPIKIKLELKQIYEQLNPAELKRVIDTKTNLLYKTYKTKNQTQNINPLKKLTPVLVRK